VIIFNKDFNDLVRIPFDPKMQLRARHNLPTGALEIVVARHHQSAKNSNRRAGANRTRG